jgi:hypothetical protein
MLDSSFEPLWTANKPKLNKMNARIKTYFQRADGTQDSFCGWTVEAKIKELDVAQEYPRLT